MVLGPFAVVLSQSTVPVLACSGIYSADRRRRAAACFGDSDRTSPTLDLTKLICLILLSGKVAEKL